MGLVNWKNRKTGAVVRAEFPLPTYPILVVPFDESGAELQHMAPADFAAAYSQDLPELPKVNPSNIPIMDVVPGPAPHVGAPALQGNGGELPGHATPKVTHQYLDAAFAHLLSEIHALRDVVEEVRELVRPAPAAVVEDAQTAAPTEG